MLEFIALLLLVRRGELQMRVLVTAGQIHG
jgi:hypothetical protein